MSSPAQPPARYRIRIRGQAALFGLLARLRDLGATLLLVERLTFDHRDPP